jgi:hypothetical protein
VPSRANPPFSLLSEKWGGDRGGAHLQFTCSLLKRGGATEQGGGAHGSAPSRPWWCTPPLPVPAPAPALLGHIQVGTALGVAVPLHKWWQCPTRTAPSRPPQLVTATGVAVHWTRHGGAPGVAHRAWECLFFFTFFTTFANVLKLQVSHHHVQVC